jgi:hypothetical protein
MASREEIGDNGKFIEMIITNEPRITNNEKTRNV